MIASRLGAWIIVAAVFALLAGGCGESPFETSGIQAEPGVSPVPGYPRGAPLASGGSLPAPSLILAELERGRSASYTENNLSVMGSLFMAQADWHQRVEADAGRAVFSPRWDGNDAAGMAFAIYNFSLPGYDLSGHLSLDWDVPPARSSDAWVALGNVDLDRWEWYPCNPGSSIVTPGFTPYLSAESRLLAAVVVLGRNDPVLSRVRVGSGIAALCTALDGTPLADARVALGNLAPVAVNPAGEAALLGLAPSERLVATCSAPGYVSMPEVFRVDPGALLRKRCELPRRAAPAGIPVADGGEAALLPSGSLSIPATSLVNGDGMVLPGTANLYATLLQTADPQVRQAVPAYLAENGVGDLQALAIYTLLEIFVDDGTGQPAFLSAGAQASLNLPVPDQLAANPPASLNLYAFNAKTGYWELQGYLDHQPATQFYTGEITHFSLLCCAVPIESTCIDVHAADAASLPVYGAAAELDSADPPCFSDNWTDSAGHALLRAPLSSAVTVSASLPQGQPDSQQLISPDAPAGMQGPCPAACELAISRPPVARVTLLQEIEGDLPCNAQLGAFSSTSSNGRITGYEWDFNAADGVAWSAGTPDGKTRHVYMLPGDYYVQVRVTDEAGLSAVAGLLLCVRPSLGIESPPRWPQAGGDARNTHYSPYPAPVAGALLSATTFGQSISSAPAVAGDGTMYLAVQGQLYALYPDGTVKWNIYNGAQQRLSPALDQQGNVYVGSFLSKLYVYNSSGDKLWDFTLDDQAQAGPVLDLSGNVYVISQQGVLYSIDPAGTERWQYAIGSYNDARPAIGPDGTVYTYKYTFHLGPGSVIALNQDGSLKWEIISSYWGLGQLCVGPDGTIYKGDEVGLTAINPDQTFKWQYDLVDHGVASEIAVAPDGSICFMEEFGNLVSLDADGHERWSYPSGWVQTGSPVICQDGKVLFLSTSGLTALSADGELLWQNNFQSPAFGPVVLDGKAFCVGGSSLYCIGW